MPAIGGYPLDMTAIAAYVFGILLLYVVGRIFFMPLRLVFKLVYNGLIGGAMLWAVNFVGSHFAFAVPINPFTALIAGFLGIPGVILLILFKLFIV